MVRVGTQRKAGALGAVQKREKHGKRIINYNQPPPSHLVARLAVAKSKHHSYYEIADNTDKKKKLEVQNTHQKTPYPGFTFVPIGNPALTDACKELSREQGAVVYIVSETPENKIRLGSNVYRIGYHFRSIIVEQCATELDIPQFRDNRAGAALEVLPVFNVNKIPETQAEIDAQADAAIRDLFPRIPNTDRQMIIERSFKKGSLFGNSVTVGNAENLTLARRVQLAVIAHIRHTHTRYDLLLRESSWENARKTVESLVLDILIKWRGDEETGRDQLDEVLREIVVISDSEGDDEDTGDSDTDAGTDTETDDDMVSDAEVNDADVEENEEEILTVYETPSEVTLKANDSVTATSLTVTNNAPDKSDGGTPSTRARAIVPLNSALTSRHYMTPRMLKRQRRKAQRDAGGKVYRNRKANKAKAKLLERNARQNTKRYEAYQKALARRERPVDLDRPNPRVDDNHKVHDAHTNEGPQPSGLRRTLRVYNDDPMDNSMPAGLLTKSTIEVASDHQNAIDGNGYDPRSQFRPTMDMASTSEQPRQTRRVEYTKPPGYEPNLVDRNREPNGRIITGQYLRRRDDVPADVPLPSIEQGAEKLASHHSSHNYDRSGRQVRYHDHDVHVSRRSPRQYDDIICLDGTNNTPPKRHVLHEEHIRNALPQEHVVRRDQAQQPRRARMVRVITVPDYDRYDPLPHHSARTAEVSDYRPLHGYRLVTSGGDASHNVSAVRESFDNGLAVDQYAQPGSEMYDSHHALPPSSYIPYRSFVPPVEYEHSIYDDQVKHSGRVPTTVAHLRNVPVNSTRYPYSRVDDVQQYHEYSRLHERPPPSTFSSQYVPAGQLPSRNGYVVVSSDTDAS